MLDRDAQIAKALERMAPTTVHERGDWTRLVDDASQTPPDLSRSSRTPIRALHVRRVALGLAVVALIAVVPALAISQEWWFLGDAPRATGDVTTVTAVRAEDGSLWRLTAYVSEDAGICVGLTPSSDASSGAAMSCGAGVRGEPNLPPGVTRHALGIALTGGATRPTFVFGTAAAAVVRVDIELGDGDRIVAAATLPAPHGLGANSVRFYVREVPANPDVTAVTARDRNLDVIERRSLPSRS
jgi:hypothetical protein